MKRPTIAAVLAQFLGEQQQRLSPKTFAQYRDVVELLQHSLNGYAYQTLNELDAKRFDRLHKAPGDAHREFCEIFGPEYLLPNVGEFLGYFMVRKVMAGPALLRAAGTVTKKLGKRSAPGLLRVAMAMSFRAAPPRPQPPGSPAAAGLANVPAPLAARGGLRRPGALSPFPGRCCALRCRAY